MVRAFLHQPSAPRAQVWLWRHSKVGCRMSLVKQRQLSARSQ
jgi:hypothetical protein